MSYLILPAVCLLLFFYLASTVLPWLALADRISGRSRSVYYKSARQLSLLGFWLQLFLLLALGLYLLLGGVIVSRFNGFWLQVLEIILIALGASAVLLLLSCIWQRSSSPEQSKSSVGTLILVLGCLHSLLAFLLGSVLGWAFLQGLTSNWQPDLALPANWLLDLTQFSGIWLFICYLAACLFLALGVGYILSMIWFVLRRNRDDFGRDYYTGIISRSGGRAFFFSLLLLLTAIGNLVLTWYNPLPRLGSFFDLSNEIMLILFACLGLCLPIALLCLRSISVSPHPMRKKTMIWLAFLLLFCWVYSWLGRIWI